MKTLGAMPQILCWKCRRLTSFEVDLCEHCGSAFAGSTGGAYRSGLIATGDAVSSSKRTVEPRSRSLSDIVADLRRIRDLSDSPRGTSRVPQGSLPLYQCPTCGRFVAETATACVCGVRFAPPSAVTFLCPECGASVPSAEDVCPVCRVEFHATGLRDEYVYACPRCGAHVASDAFRCSCGARFEA
jgi:predicted amidophosphoribosyltransferase